MEHFWEKLAPAVSPEPFWKRWQNGAPSPPPGLPPFPASDSITKTGPVTSSGAAHPALPLVITAHQSQLSNQQYYLLLLLLNFWINNKYDRDCCCEQLREGRGISEGL